MKSTLRQTAQTVRTVAIHRGAVRSLSGAPLEGPPEGETAQLRTPSIVARTAGANGQRRTARTRDVTAMAVFPKRALGRCGSTSRQAGPGPARPRLGSPAARRSTKPTRWQSSSSGNGAAAGLRLVVPPRLRRASTASAGSSCRRNGAASSRTWCARPAAWRRHGVRSTVAAEARRGIAPLSPEIWELSLPDGAVVAITRSRAEAHHLANDPRFVVTYTLSRTSPSSSRSMGPTSPGRASSHPATRSRRKRARSTIRSIRRA